MCEEAQNRNQEHGGKCDQKHPDHECERARIALGVVDASLIHLADRRIKASVDFEERQIKLNKAGV